MDCTAALGNQLDRDSEIQLLWQRTRPCITRLFGNIVGEQISETCSLVSKRNDKTFPPFLPFLFLRGRDAPILYSTAILSHRWLATLA